MEPVGVGGRSWDHVRLHRSWGVGLLQQGSWAARFWPRAQARLFCLTASACFLLLQTAFRSLPVDCFLDE